MSTGKRRRSTTQLWRGRAVVDGTVSQWDKKAMPEVFVCQSTELGEGARKIVTNGADQIGVIRAGGVLHAFRNACPHQGGPVCEGLIVHKVEEVIAADRTYQGMRFNENELHIVCPWHGWEFNIATGHCAGDGKHALKRYRVLERDNGIYVVV
jgi:nitrite reductase (NADH) small subunit